MNNSYLKDRILDGSPLLLSFPGVGGGDGWEGPDILGSVLPSRKKKKQENRKIQEKSIARHLRSSENEVQRCFPRSASDLRAFVADLGRAH